MSSLENDVGILCLSTTKPSSSCQKTSSKFSAPSQLRRNVSHQRHGARRIDFQTDPTAGSVAWYIQYGRELVGCKSLLLAPVFRSGSHRTRWIAHKKLVRGEGNCGRVIDRGKEAFETMGKRRVYRLPSVRHCPTRMVSHQDRTGYEQKSHLRPTTPGECAIQNTVLLRFGKLEEGAEVDEEFGQGQFTFLSGESWDVPVSKHLRLNSGAIKVTCFVHSEVSRGRSTSASNAKGNGKD